MASLCRFGSLRLAPALWWCFRSYAPKNQFPLWITQLSVPCPLCSVRSWVLRQARDAVTGVCAAQSHSALRLRCRAHAGGKNVALHRRAILLAESFRRGSAQSYSVGRSRSAQGIRRGVPSRTKRDAHGCLVALSFRGKEVGHRFPGTLAELLDSRTLATNSSSGLSSTLTCGMPRR